MNEIDIIRALNEYGLPNVLRASGLYWALGKPARETISRLVGGVADIPLAKIAAISRAINDDADARSTIRKALAEAAAKVAAGDADLVDRALVAHGSKLVRQQRNREKVAEKTIHLLTDEPASPDQTEGPSVDFINQFEILAENASSEDMQDLFARVLAGEIRRPKSFSLRALQFMQVMDGDLAALIAKYRNWAIGNSIIRITEFNSAPLLQQIQTLGSLGFINSEQGLTITSPSKDFAISLGSKVISITADVEIFRIPVLAITQFGQEIFSILTKQDDVEMIFKVAQQIKSLPNVTGVRVLDKVPNETGFDLTNPIEIP